MGGAFGRLRSSVLRAFVWDWLSILLNRLRVLRVLPRSVDQTRLHLRYFRVSLAKGVQRGVLAGDFVYRFARVLSRKTRYFVLVDVVII